MILRRNLYKLIGLAVASFLGGCATPVAPLYAWETFPRQQYEVLLREGASPLAQITVMTAHAERARMSKSALPPGFRAHLGMLHLAVGDVDAARTAWNAEKQAFPESAAYMDSLLKKLDITPKSPSMEKPA